MPPSRVTNRAPWRAELVRGARLLRQGDRAGARASFERAHRLAPGEPEPALALGREQWKAGQLEDAERLIRVALDNRPDWPLAIAALVRILAARGERQQADRMLRAARQKHPRNSALMIIEGELHLDWAEPDQAVASFREARAVGANHEAVTFGLSRAENAQGIELCRRGGFSEAAFAFKRAADLAPNWPAPYINLGAILYRLERYGKARKAFERALELDIGHPVAHFNLGLLALRENDLARAERAFSSARALGHPRALRQLAVVVAERGRSPQAVALFAEAIVREDVDATLYCNYGVALLRDERRSEAEAAFRQALELDETHGQTLKNLVILLAGDGRALEAARLYRRLERLGLAGPPPSSPSSQE